MICFIFVLCISYVIRWRKYSDFFSVVQVLVEFSDESLCQKGVIVAHSVKKWAKDLEGDELFPIFAAESTTRWRHRVLCLRML